MPISSEWDPVEKIWTLTAGETFQLTEIFELAGRYELPFAEPDWIADVIERYGLNPPF